MKPNVPAAAALGIAGTTAAVGAGVGAVAGGLVGVLADWGFSEAEVREYEARVGKGDILLTVEVPDEAAGRAEEILRRNSADHVRSSAARP